MELIVAAFITGGFGIVSAIFANQRRRGAVAEKETAVAEKQKTETALEKFTEGIAVEAAYSVKRVEIIIEFDNDGKGTQQKRWIKLQCTQSIQNLQIPFTYRLAAPGARLTGEIKGKELPGSTLAAEPREEERTDHASRGTILLAGQSGPTSGEISFFLEHGVKNAYCMTRQQALEAFKNDDWKQEYVTCGVQVPIEIVIVQVSFPPSHHNLHPVPIPVAFISGTEMLHTPETLRLPDSFYYDGMVARLEVPEPKIGLSYAISWMPPEVHADG